MAYNRGTIRKKFKGLFEYSLDLIYVNDLEGNLLDANRVTLKKLGFNESEIKNLNFSDLLDGKNLSKARRHIREILMERKPKKIKNYAVRAKEGKLIHIDSYGIPLFRDGEIYAILGIARDITKRKKLKNQLKNSLENTRDDLEQQKRNFKNILESIQEGYYETDLKGKFTFLNDAFCKIAGETKEQITGRNYKEYMSKDVGREVFHIFNEIYHTKEEQCNLRWSFIRSDKKKVYLEGSISLKYDKKSRKPMGFRGIVRDITERKIAEKKLKESKNKYEHIAELLPDIIYEADRKGFITYVNSAGFRKFGYNENDLKKGINIMDLLTEKYKNKARENIKKLLNDRKTEPTKYLMVKRDGSKFFARIHSKPIIKKGKVVGIRGTVSDINKMVTAQQKIKKYSNEMEFYKNLLMHDMKNILSNIQSSIRLQEMWKNDDTKALKNGEMRKITKKQLERGISLLMFIQRISELKNSKLPLKNISLDTPLEKTIKFVSSRFQDIDLTIDTQLKNNIQVKAGDLLIDAFENLLLNAVVHNNSKVKRIWIAGSKIQMDDKEYIKIEFKDNGKGIIDEKKGNIFLEKYKKIHKSGGMGLGLSIVKRIIHQYDGKIWVENRVPGNYKQGSNFIVLLEEA